MLLTRAGTSLSDFALSIPQRELKRISDDEAEVQDDLNRFSERRSVNEYSDRLTKVKEILPILSQDPHAEEVARQPCGIPTCFWEIFSSPPTTQLSSKE
jgi:hypothetical protein